LLNLVLAVVWIGIALSALVSGMDYYLLPVETRAYSPLAPIYSPTGIVGHGLGIVGTAMIVVGVVGYGARKRFGFLAGLGALKHWLQVHIFLCTLGPFLVLLHTAFRFGGIVSIAFWSMTAVVISGVFGRYVYVRIPKTIQGRFLSLETVRSRVVELADRVRAVVGGSDVMVDDLLPDWERGAPRGLVAALTTALGTDIRFRMRQRRIRRELQARQVPRHLHDEILETIGEGRRLVQQATLLEPFQKLFRYWHVFHLPLAVVMFLILGVHVFVAVLFGYTWIF